MKQQSRHAATLGIKSEHSIEKLTPYHYRVAGVLDLYPTNYKWHNIKTGKRGRYFGKSKEQMAAFIAEQIAAAGPERKPSLPLARSAISGRCLFCGGSARGFICEAHRHASWFELVGLPRAKEAN